ncbi:MAG: hypothetical protein F6K42_13975 [Leptolyngbya sp. SIO1D8]|nr:hypothetical protein [Leptolyngbya sp. SIO1D8]
MTRKTIGIKNSEATDTGVTKIDAPEHMNPQLPSLDTLQPLFGDDKQHATLQKCIHYRPFLKSCLAPISVGDLLIIEQELCGYEEGEIAQIENIMARERKEFSSRDVNRITETTESSFEREIEESQSTKVDERFSLSVQAQEAQSQQMSISGNVSASYRAPAFSASISANASYSNSKDSSYATSQEYAKNVTEEASKRVREAISEVKKVTIFTESVKNSLHGFNNTTGETHIRGIYRWIDKKYKAQLFDYGKRLFLQFFVPEPAFYLRDIDKLIEREALTDLKPTVHPRDRAYPIKSYKDISETDYGEIAAEYDVTDIAPPPPKFLVRGKGIAHPDADQGIDDNGSQDHSEATLAKNIDSIIIESGYHLIEWQANIPLLEIARPDKNGLNANIKYGYYTTIGFSDTTHDVNLLLVNILGTTCYYLTHNDSADNDKHIMVNSDRFDVWHPVSYELEGEIPITIGAEFQGKFYLNLIYKMERNAETLEKWQIDTYARILQGYNNKLQAYEQKLKEAELSRDTQIGELKVQPREETYREIESHELRKHCVDILTRHTAFAEVPSKLNELNNGQLEINLTGLFGIPNWQANNVNGVTSAFFEDAFEWEMMTYKLYPYFWTDKKRWHHLYRQPESGDALFDQFLKAGYARVVVPLRPNYERSILYYLKTNMIWAGGEVPAFENDTHLSLLEELHNSVQLEKGNGTPVGESWDVRLPTSFIYLQETQDLPAFECLSVEPGTGGSLELPSEELIEEQEAELEALTTSKESPT